MDINDASFAVQRGDTVFSCLGNELKDKLQADDLMMVRRGDIDYKWAINEAQGPQLPPGPWDGAVGIWHVYIEDGTKGVSWWPWDGTAITGLYKIDSSGNILETLDLTAKIKSPGEFLVTTGANASYLFNKDDYGMTSTMRGKIELRHWTDTSQVVSMNHIFNGLNNKASSADRYDLDLKYVDTSSVTSSFGMFLNANVAVYGVEDWDVSNNANFGQMFKGTELGVSLSKWNTKSAEGSGVFQNFFGVRLVLQDLSEWCVSGLSSASIGWPEDDDTLISPVWGTCPRGEDQA